MHNSHHAVAETALSVLHRIPDVSSAVADALDHLGCGDSIGTSGLVPLIPGTRVCGPALTLRYRRLDGSVADNRRDGLGELGDRALYESARPGDVAVFECPPPADTAVVGAISARWARLAGVAGCIVDGAIRDSGSIIGSGLPVWSSARAARAARHRYTTDATGIPVRIGGMLVTPGDIVIADDDGLCVVPPAALDEVVDLCVRADAIERALLRTMAESDSPADLHARLARAGADASSIDR